VEQQYNYYIKQEGITRKPDLKCKVLEDILFSKTAAKPAKN